VAGRDDPDVLVVGGGPAGCAAATWAVRRGLRAELLHRPEQDAYRPGETLHPGIEPLLRRLGAEEALLAPGFPRTAGHFVSWGERDSFEAYGADGSGPWRGFQACRQTLERGLREAAQRAGVVVTETAARVAPLAGPDGRVAGARVEGVGDTTARAVVDAAGSRHWLARGLGLEVRRWSPRLIARFGVVSGALPGRDEPSLRARADGWTWIAPVADDAVAWVRLALRDGDASATAVPEELSGLTPRGRTGGADVTWRLVPQTAGPGYAVAGDAAFVLDPLSSHGVLHAVMSGMMAAEMLAKHLLGGVPEAVTTAAYRRWMRSRFTADVAGLRALYAALLQPPAWADR